jgi:predicted helicase
MDIKKTLHEIFLSSPPNRFDSFIDVCQKWYSRPSHTIAELKTRDNKKIKGDIFEDFCVLYLSSKSYTAWRLEDVPEDILVKLSLKRRDMGIDIVCEKAGIFSAVQCKYKAPNGKKMGVSWKTLSTFYSLCMRSGPWDKYIVMTNCNYVSHVGKKTEKDISIVLNSFQTMTSEEWIQMCGLGERCAIVNELTPEELREARLKRFS